VQDTGTRHLHTDNRDDMVTFSGSGNSRATNRIKPRSRVIKQLIKYLRRHKESMRLFIYTRFIICRCKLQVISIFGVPHLSGDHASVPKILFVIHEYC